MFWGEGVDLRFSVSLIWNGSFFSPHAIPFQKPERVEKEYVEQRKGFRALAYPNFVPRDEVLEEKKI